MAKKKYQFKLKKREALFLAISLIAFSVSCVSYLLYLKFFAPILRWNYYGFPLEFRRDLRQASKIEVYPNENSLRIFYNPRINTIYIAFKNTTQNSLVEVEGWEISFKLKTFYMHLNRAVKIKGMNGTSYNITGNPTSPVIVLIPPVDSNFTGVKVENYTVYISGRTFPDFDLATEKFLMVILGIKV